MNPRILVVGGVAAGPTAASKAKRTNPAAEVVLFEQGEYVSSGVCEFPYFIGNVFDDPALLAAYSPERLKVEKGITVKIHHRVEEIRPVQRKVRVRDLEKRKMKEWHYDRLILATGSRPVSLGMQGEDGRNVFHIRTLEGCLALKKYIDTAAPRSAVIIGAGYVGMEMAEALVANGIRTTILQRSVLPISSLETETRTAIAGELERHGVEFVPECTVHGLGTDSTGKVVEVETSQGTYETDLVILSVGVKPNVFLAQAARITVGPHEGILTDQRQGTSIDGIFAAGDCCEVKNLVDNSWMYVPLATLASKQARVAGANAAGGNLMFKGGVRAIGVKIFDLQVAHVGLSRREASDSGFEPMVEHIEANSRISFFPGNEKLHVVAVAERTSRRLLGANCFGKDGAIQRANVLSLAIRHKLTIEDLAQEDLIYSPHHSPLWDPLLILANHMRKK